MGVGEPTFVAHPGEDLAGASHVPFDRAGLRGRVRATASQGGYALPRNEREARV